MSVFRLIWCSRLCSKHSWSARVNRSCRTWAGRLRDLGTGGCRRTPPHDSPSGKPVQSHPPEASLPPSWPSLPHWLARLQVKKQKQNINKNTKTKQKQKKTTNALFAQTKIHFVLYDFCITFQEMSPTVGIPYRLVWEVKKTLELKGDKASKHLIGLWEQHNINII